MCLIYVQLCKLIDKRQEIVTSAVSQNLVSPLPRLHFLRLRMLVPMMPKICCLSRQLTRLWNTACVFSAQEVKVRRKEGRR